MDPVYELRRVEAPVSEEELAAAEARTLAALAAPLVRRRSRRRWALVPAAVCAVALLGVVSLRGGAQPEPASAATRFLRSVADRAESRDIVLAPGQFYAVRSIERTDVEDATYEARTWRDRDGNGIRQWLKDSRVVKRSRLGPAGDAETGLTYDQVLALPTDRDALARRLREVATAPQPILDARTHKPTGKTIQPRASFAPRDTMLAAIDLLGSERPLPGELRAALFDVMAAIPGVRYVGAVRDPLGREGVAVAIDGDEAHELYGREAIIDPRTSELLATIEYRHGDLRRVAGTHTRREAVVDRPGAGF